LARQNGTSQKEGQLLPEVTRPAKKKRGQLCQLRRWAAGGGGLVLLVTWRCTFQIQPRLSEGEPWQTRTHSLPKERWIAAGGINYLFDGPVRAGEDLAIKKGKGTAKPTLGGLKRRVRTEGLPLIRGGKVKKVEFMMQNNL